ncbi:MAG: GDP-mannose 4,6-dehydratase [Chloroflexi bacterium]|nr:GDP-mannose 4,6-dehydratase [Chloroflexota bacterium]MCL5275884.1 GDP-mannose 4,6-dehydratase [Chloroflexota bacterium]
MRLFVTGGAGFIGCNLTARFLGRGDSVTVYDNLSRPRTVHNLEWLRSQPRDAKAAFSFIQGDVRDAAGLQTAMSDARPDLVVHLASQVAVTTSVINPREDFEINALGTFNVLEAARTMAAPPAVFFASTNKVYGGMEDVVVVQEPTRYRYRDLPNGVSEQQPLDFHSPYGCSKGAGDQYVRDYARIYGLRTVVFRQSCIYGERQFGVEDQGWVAHFVIAAAMNRPINIYGDGKQVRDLLYVQDLVNAYAAAWDHLDVASGQVFNVGGGTSNTLAIWSEFGALLGQLAGHPIPAKYADWRPGDQPVFVSDNSKARRVLGWEPQVTVRDGIQRLWNWVVANRELFGQ